MVKGSTQGAITDIDGKFTLSVDALPVTVVVSYIGYQKKEVKITSKGAIHITLAEDTQLMDEVIVTGYGTFKKSAYAGSASNVKSDKMADVPTVSFQDMLQGNATGVQFSASSGQPGASSNINIRGMGSINAGNTPLYVIDGVPVISGSINSMSSDSGLDIMSTINTNDIASITVIKDAAAASLYGSRAANGVIIITTKQGQQGKPKVSLQADWGYSDFAMDYRPVMNGQQRRDYIYNGLYAGQIRKGKTEQEATAYADDNIDDYAPIPWCGFIDWDDVLFKKGSHQQYEASVSGGADKFKYYSSIAYLKQDGITHRSGLERLTGRLNVDYKATNRLTLGANIFFSSVNQDVYSEGFTYTAPFYSSRSAVTPSDPVYNEDGTWNRAFIRIGDRNPALANEYDSQREYVTRTFNTVYGQLEFIKDLKFKTTFSYDYITTKGKDWADPRTSNGDDINGGMSKKFYERNLSIPMVNDTISSVLFMKSKERKAHSEFCKFLYGNRGPIWYRGLVLNDKKWSHLPSDSLDMVLRRYDVDRIFVGHTIFKDIKRFYNGRVIAVNVDNQENYEHRRGRAVLMTDDKLFVVGDKGIKKQLKVKR